MNFRMPASYYELPSRLEPIEEPKHRRTHCVDCKGWLKRSGWILEDDDGWIFWHVYCKKCGRLNDE